MGLWVNGTYTEVHPTFLYESLWNIAGLLLIYFLVVRARKFDGEVFLCYIAWYGLGRFFIEGLRTDSLYFFGLTLFGQPVGGVLPDGGGPAGVEPFGPASYAGGIVCEPPPGSGAGGGEERSITMSATIIDGKALAAKCKARIAGEAAGLKTRPGLAVIIVGDNPASRIYVNNKKKDCEECGIYSEEYALPAEAGEARLLELIHTLNESDSIDGILVQLPLPKGYDEEKVLLAIRPDKDVDAFHPYNVGKIMIGDPTFVPCTPAGVMRMLEEYGIDPNGKHCVVVGRSNIVGKPQTMLLLHKGGTVTICHSRTPDLKAETLRADILVSASSTVGPWYQGIFSRSRRAMFSPPMALAGMTAVGVMSSWARKARYSRSTCSNVAWS